MRVLLLLGALAAHPLHTTLTELEVHAAGGAVQLTVRAFEDDLRATLDAGGAVTDSAAARYARATVTLSDRTGRAVPLAWCGLRRSDGVVWLCLRGTAPSGAGLRVRVGLLFERYADQINIVQTSRDGRRGGGALLFTRGDPPKPVP